MPGARDVAKVAKYRSFVFYGRSGTGKTTLACSAPGPAILLDIRDEGQDSVADVDGLMTREIEDTDDFEDAYWWLKKNPDRYKTVIVDTISQLQQILVKEKGEKVSKKGKRAGDWGSMTQRDWGDIAAYIKEWIINYRDLTKDGMNVIFIAQDRVFNAGDDEESDDQIAPEVGPQLSPATAKFLNAAVSMIGNMFIRSRIVKKEDKKTKKKTSHEVHDYCLRVGPSSAYVTKVRKPRDIVAPAFIVDPTYEDILAIIKGE